MFELVDNAPQNAVIKVIGVGGGGGNAVQHMIARGVEGVEFICANTDAQALQEPRSPHRAAARQRTSPRASAPAPIRRSAGRRRCEDRDRIAEVLDGADMVFITAGMGGGTGTGACAGRRRGGREMEILTVAVVTKPFPLRGRQAHAGGRGGHPRTAAARRLADHHPQREAAVGAGRRPPRCSMPSSAANDVLLGAVQGIADLIIRPGMINVDFADVRTVMSEMGMAMMGTGIDRREPRARRRRSGDPQPAARGHRSARCPRHPGQRHRRSGAGIGEFRRSVTPSRASPPIPPPSSSARSSIPSSRTRCGSPSSPRVSACRASPKVVVDNAPTPATAHAQRGLRPADGRCASPAVAGAGSEDAAAAARTPDADMDYLDIPAFLRRQAD